MNQRDMELMTESERRALADRELTFALMLGAQAAAAEFEQVRRLERTAG